VSIKTEINTLLMRTPMAKPQNLEGELVIKVKMSDEMPEIVANSKQAAEIGEEGMKAAGYIVIEVAMKVGDLTDDDIIGCTPEKYMENGIVAGILDAIRYGLTDDRGINFKYAVTDAQEKAQTVTQCIEAESLMDKVNKIGLAIADARGNA